MQLFNGTSTDDGTVYCPRINLSEASELPSQVADSGAWPARSRKQQLEGLFFSPRAICTSPDDFSEMVRLLNNSFCSSGEAPVTYAWLASAAACHIKEAGHAKRV